MDSDHTDHDSPAEAAASEATLLLRRVQEGDDSAVEQFLPLVYEQLRATAGNVLQHESRTHTLQPTALVHEAFIKLVSSDSPGWNSRAHFCAVAAMAMRQILRDYVRAARASKRGGGRPRRSLTTVVSEHVDSPIDAMVLDETLEQLSAADERAARVFEMRFFGGLAHEEVAALLNVSMPTVERAWRRARAWIASAIAEGSA